MAQQGAKPDATKAGAQGWFQVVRELRVASMASSNR
jgi:hypothetical protein